MRRAWVGSLTYALISQQPLKYIGKCSRRQRPTPMGESARGSRQPHKLAPSQNATKIKALSYTTLRRATQRSRRLTSAEEQVSIKIEGSPYACKHLLEVIPGPTLRCSYAVWRRARRYFRDICMQQRKSDMHSACRPPEHSEQYSHFL